MKANEVICNLYNVCNDKRRELCSHSKPHSPHKWGNSCPIGVAVREDIEVFHISDTDKGLENISFAYKFVRAKCVSYFLAICEEVIKNE